MSLEQMEHEKIKKAVLEILTEQPEILKPILLKVLSNQEGNMVVQQALRKMKISAMIDEDFDKFDNVFKALA